MLSEFISEVKSRGIANPNKFRVEIAIPQVVPTSVFTQELKFIQLFCDQTQLPDQNISTAQIRIYGEVREVPYENLYGNVNFSFYCDSDYIVKDFFDYWVQGLSFSQSRHWRYYDDYTSNINIITLNQDGREVYAVTLYECYPKQLQAVSLDYSSKEIVKVNISMNYKYWRANRISNSTQTSVNQDNNRFNNQDVSNLSESLDSPINGSFPIPQEYLDNFNEYQQNINSFGGFADRIFGNSQNVFTEIGDNGNEPFIILADEGVVGADEF